MESKKFEINNRYYLRSTVQRLFPPPPRFLKELPVIFFMHTVNPERVALS